MNRKKNTINNFIISVLICSMCCLFLFSGCSANVASKKHHDAVFFEKDAIQCISDHESLPADLITNLTYETCTDGEHHKYNVSFDYEDCSYTCIYDIDSKNVSEFHHLDEENGTHHSSTHHNETEHLSTHHNETEHLSTHHNETEHLSTHHNETEHLSTHHNETEHLSTHHNETHN